MKHGINGIVLAGGKSSRMGTDKGLVPYKGIPMVEHMIRLIQPYCKGIFISANTSGYEGFGYQVVPDIHLHKGPLAGIHAGLSASDTNWNLVVSCDMPLITAIHVEKLLQYNAEGSTLVAAKIIDRVQPLFACYHRALIPSMEEHLKEDRLKMMHFLEEVHAHYVIFDEQNDLMSFSNFNHLSDFDKP